MKRLLERIKSEGKYLGDGILKVDSFMNHQIDPSLMEEIGKTLAAMFADARPTKVLTAETSGIPPALFCALALGIPVIYARKHAPITMAAGSFRETAPSRTKGGDVDLIVSSEYLGPDDRVLIIDDFLATAQTTVALAKVVDQSGAELIGIGAVIEKAFDNGRAKLGQWNVPVHSLAIIESFENDQVVFKTDKAVL
jgi:xanthine phosphoribosyltransferase